MLKLSKGCTIKDFIFLISSDKAAGDLFVTRKVLRTGPGMG